MWIVHSTSMTSGTIIAATTTDMTVKLGITLPKSILQTMTICVAILLGAGIFGGQLKDILVVIVVKT